MRLTFTKYLDAEPHAVADSLDAAVVRGLDAAAERIGTSRSELVTEGIHEGLRVAAGLEILDGSEVRVGGESRLTTLELSIPWNTTNDRGGSKLLAADTFAAAVANEVARAA